MGADYDVFLSYARKDGEAVRALVEALRAKGLTVWFDERDIESFQDITAGIVDGMGRSGALVAYYSQTYLQRRACQWELSAALLALQNPTERQRRILVVNPEAEPTHIHPAELRGALYRRATAAGDAEGLRWLSSEIARRVGELSGSLAVGQPLSRPRWLPVQRGSTRFVGRLPDLFEINRVLHGSDYPASSGDFGPGTAVLQGLGGIGKTLLVEEYGLRFGPAYPGGIFWLSAPGDGASQEVLEATQLEAELLRQLGAIAALLLGQDTRRMDVNQLKGLLAGEIERHGESCLWVVDDLPSGLSPESARQWFSPHPKARTLITTRSRLYGALAQPVQLGVLSPEDAYQLLTSRRRPEDELEEAAARGVVEDLGRHALAVDVAGAVLRINAGLQSFAVFRAELANPAEDELEYGAQLMDDLPHERASIAATLLRSLRRLNEEGQDLLLLASCLAAEPMSPSFLARIFQRADQLEKPLARRRVAQAVQQCESLSLLERVGDTGDCTVHRLVSRTVRFHDYRPERQGQLKAAAISVLGEELKQAGDIRKHSELASLMPHARELVAGSQTVEELDLLGWVARFDFVRGVYTSARALGSHQLEAYRRLLGEDHPNTLTALNNLGTTLHTQGELPAARRLFEQALEAYRRLLGEDHPSTVRALNNLAQTLSAQGELPAARRLQEQALEANRRLLGEDHPQTLLALNNLASTVYAQGELPAARRLFEQALEANRQLLGEDHPSAVRALNNLAQVVSAQGELPAARRLFEQALEANRRLLGEEHPDTVNTLNNLGTTLHAQGELPAARRLFEQALEANRRLLGEDHPNTLLALNNLGLTLHAQGALPAARRLQEQALEANRQLLGEDHPSTLLALNNLAATLYAQGELAAARHLQEQALEASHRLLGEDHPNTLLALSNLGLTLNAQDELPAARRLQEQALEASRRLLGEDHPNTLLALHNLAGTLHAQGDLPAARHLQEQALEASRRLLGEDHPNTLGALNNLAQTFYAQGELPAARRLQEQALEAARRLLGEDHPNTLGALHNLALTLRAQGELPAARRLQEQDLEASRRLLGEDHPTTLLVLDSLALTLYAQGELVAALGLQEQALEAYRRLLGEDHPQALGAIRNLAATRQALEEQ